MIITPAWCATAPPYPRRVRTPDAEYAARLEHCRACPSLNAGTCMQCGCYVEMRAARTDMHCPLDKAPW